MSLPFFADQCVPLEMSEALRAKGHQVILLRDQLPIRSPDPAVIAKAQELDCILFSLNGDFADIVVYPPSNCGGIVAVQVHNHPEIIPQLIDRLAAFLDVNPDRDYYRGKLFIVEVHRIRVRS